MEKIFCHLGSQKGGMLCLQCTKMRLVAGLHLDPLGSYCDPQTSYSYEEGAYF